MQKSLVLPPVTAMLSPLSLKTERPWQEEISAKSGNCEVEVWTSSLETPPSGIKQRQIKNKAENGDGQNHLVRLCQRYPYGA